MNFSEPFQTVTLGLLSYLVVRIINQMITFNVGQAFFMDLRNSFLKLSENYKKERALLGL